MATAKTSAKKTAEPKKKAPKAAPVKAEKKAAPKGSKASPLAVMKEKFGDKAKLVEAVTKLTTEALWVGRTNKDRGGDKGLDHVSNAKLLRLHSIFTAVTEKFGSREKLIAAILDTEKRTKDEGYKSRLSAFPVPRLWDHFRTVEKRAKARAAAPEAPKAAKPAKAAKKA